MKTIACPYSSNFSIVMAGLLLQKKKKTDELVQPSQYKLPYKAFRVVCLDELIVSIVILYLSATSATWNDLTFSQVTQQHIHLWCRRVTPLYIFLAAIYGLSPACHVEYLVTCLPCNCKCFDCYQAHHTAVGCLI